MEEKNFVKECSMASKKNGDFNALLDSSSMMETHRLSEIHQKHMDSISLEEKNYTDEWTYGEEEDELACARFPHLKFCLCLYPCIQALQNNPIYQIYDGILLSNLHGSFKTKNLLELKVKYILNLSCTYYTKRKKYFEYFDLDIKDSEYEDAQKHFRITNRYIDNARSEGKILLHSLNGLSRAPTFVLAYLIGKQKIKLNVGLQILRSFNPKIDPNPNFMKQLIEYDLLQLAIK